MNAPDEKLAACSFCTKTQKQVRKLIAGPSVYICDECIDLCNDIIEEEFEPDAREDVRLPFGEATRLIELLQHSLSDSAFREAVNLTNADGAIVTRLQRAVESSGRKYPEGNSSSN